MRISTFLQKASRLSGKQTAADFLAEHAEYLSQFDSVLPVLVMLEAGDILPTPALMQVQELILTEKDPEVGEEVVDRETGEITVLPSPAAVAKKEKAKRAPKYMCMIFTDEGKDIAETFYEDDYGAAERAAHRKLFHNASACWCDISGCGAGINVTTRVTRVAAMGKILRHGPGGKVSTRKTSAGTGSLVVPVAKESRAHFSKG